MAWATDGFASLNRDVLPSSAGLSNSHLKATAGQSYKCQQAHSKQSFFLTRPLAMSGIVKQTAATNVQAGALQIGRVLVNGQSPLMLRSDAASVAPPTRSSSRRLKPTFKLVGLRGWNKLHLGATPTPLLMPAEITARCFGVSIKIHSTVRVFFSEYFHP